MTHSRDRSDFFKDQREPCEHLERQYREIGIPAVAAAVRYQGERSATEAEQREHARGHRDSWAA